MKKIYFSLLSSTFLLFNSSYSQTTEILKDVTFGFAAGYSHNFTTTYDYSLSPSDFSLQRQTLSRGAFVISSMISIKLTPLQYDNTQKQVQVQQAARHNSAASFSDRFAINVGLNLVEVSNSVQFNKSIDGGVGFGYYFNKNAQIAIMYEAASVRQIRSWVEEKYLSKQIPNDNTVYNALDRSDNTLFYNKLVTGIALKIVFGL